MSSFDTRSPLDDLFRAVPTFGLPIDLNNDGATVQFKQEGCSTGTIQIAQTDGASGTWVLTVEQSNDGTNWVARSPSLTYSSSGVQTGITLVTTYTRLRVSTPQGAAANATVSMSARI